MDGRPHDPSAGIAGLAPEASRHVEVQEKAVLSFLDFELGSAENRLEARGRAARADQLTGDLETSWVRSVTEGVDLSVLCLEYGGGQDETELAEGLRFDGCSVHDFLTRALERYQLDQAGRFGQEVYTPLLTLEVHLGDVDPDSRDVAWRIRQEYGHEGVLIAVLGR